MHRILLLAQSRENGMVSVIGEVLRCSFHEVERDNGLLVNS